MTHDDLRDMLSQLAELPPAPNGVPVAMVVSRARASHRRRVTAAIGGTALVVAAALAIPLVLAAPRSTPSTAPPTPTPSGPVPGTADTLAAGTWTALPDPPFREPELSAAAWTGNLLYVWSSAGSSPNQEGAHAATFDPATRTWQQLPEPPLAGRHGPGVVWIAGRLVVWGGRKAGGPDFHDGAVYDPATRHWQPTAPAPARLAAGDPVEALSTHGMAVFVPDFSAHGIAGYDPVTDRWIPLAAVPDLFGPSNAEVHLLDVGGELYALLLAARGLAVLRYDWAAANWVSAAGPKTSPKVSPALLGQATVLWEPVWNGSEVLITGVYQCKPFTNCLKDTVQPGRRIQFGSLALRVVMLPKLTSAQLAVGGTALWTGHALLSQTGIWDPDTGSWRSLPDIAVPHDVIPLFHAGDSTLGYRWWAGTGVLAVLPTDNGGSKVMWLAG